METIKIKYGELSTRSMYKYFTLLIGRTFKILPLKEESSHTLKSYIDSYLIEIIGNKYLNPTLFDENPQLISVLSTVSFLSNEEYDVSTCKKEVFKCIRILEDVRDKNFSEG